MAQTKKVADAVKAPVKRAATKAKTVVATEAETLQDKAGSFANKAGDKAREYATTGKDKASGMLGDLSEMVESIAKNVDDKLGTQYGDYARKAASTVSGVADSLKNSDVDDIVEGTRKFVREKPAMAIGAAAALGFVLTRLIKASTKDSDDA